MKNNVFNIADSSYVKKMKIHIKGQDNIVSLGINGKISYLNIKIQGKHNLVSIGKNFKCSGICKIVIAGSGNNIVLDDDVQVIT